MELTHLNPDGMHANPAYSQGVMVRGHQTLIVVGGQNGIGPDGQLVGDDLNSQREQALRNVLTVLQAAGASQEHTIKLTMLIVQGQDPQAGYRAAQTVWGVHPTAITGVFVASLALPGALVEIEAMAAR